MVSIFPSVSYSYADVDEYSYGVISPDLQVAFRFTDDPSNSWSNFWVAPYVGWGFSAHQSEGLSDENTISIGLAIVSGF